MGIWPFLLRNVWVNDMMQAKFNAKRRILTQRCREAEAQRENFNALHELKLDHLFWLCAIFSGALYSSL
jgi:hypothetical protein